jgi:hypothetical protein
MHWLALAGMLAALPLWAQTGQPAAATALVAKAVHKHADAVATQRAKVQRLQGDVVAQESDSQAAAAKLKQQDAEIAELQRQLQAAKPAGAGAGQGH